MMNRRKFHRIQVNETIRLYHDHLTFEESFGDISVSGCQVFSYQKFKLGDSVKIGIINNDYQVIIIKGIVKRCSLWEEVSNQVIGQKKMTCSNCHWSGFWLNFGEDSIKLETADDSAHQRTDFIVTFEKIAFTCPRCEGDLQHTSSPLFKIGIEFEELNQETIDSLTHLVEGSLKWKKELEKTKEPKNGERIESGRDSIRVDAGFAPVEIGTEFKDSVEFYESYIKNISSGGLFIYSNKELEFNQEVRITLGVKNKGEKLVLNGKVIHKNTFKNDKRGKFGYGIKIVYFDDNLRWKLNNFVTSITQSDYKKHLAKQSLAQRMKSTMVTFSFSSVSFVLGAIVGILVLLSFLNLNQKQIATYSKPPVPPPKQPLTKVEMEKKGKQIATLIEKKAYYLNYSVKLSHETFVEMGEFIEGMATGLKGSSQGKLPNKAELQVEDIKVYFDLKGNLRWAEMQDHLYDSLQQQAELKNIKEEIRTIYLAWQDTGSKIYQFMQGEKVEVIPGLANWLEMGVLVGVVKGTMKIRFLRFMHPSPPFVYNVWKNLLSLMLLPSPPSADAKVWDVEIDDGGTTTVSWQMVKEMENDNLVSIKKTPVNVIKIMGTINGANQALDLSKAKININGGISSKYHTTSGLLREAKGMVELEIDAEGMETKYINRVEIVGVGTTINLDQKSLGDIEDAITSYLYGPSDSTAAVDDSTMMDTLEQSDYFDKEQFELAMEDLYKQVSQANEISPKEGFKIYSDIKVLMKAAPQHTLTNLEKWLEQKEKLNSFALNSIIDALGESGNSGAHQMLSKVVLDNNMDISTRSQAIQAMGEITAPQPHDVNPLMDIYSSDGQDPSLQEDASLMLGKMADSMKKEHPESRKEILSRLAQDLQSAKDPMKQIGLLSALGNSAPLEYMDLIIRYTQSTNHEVRGAAVNALRFIPSLKAGQVILTMLKTDPSEIVRSSSAYTLGFAFLPPNYVQLLIEIFSKERSALVVIKAIHSLVQKGEQVVPLFSYLANSSIPEVAKEASEIMTGGR